MQLAYILFMHLFARVHSAHILHTAWHIIITCNLNTGCICFAYVHLDAHMQYAHKQHVCNK